MKKYILTFFVTLSFLGLLFAPVFLMLSAHHTGMHHTSSSQTCVEHCLASDVYFQTETQTAGFLFQEFFLTFAFASFTHIEKYLSLFYLFFFLIFAPP